MITLLCNKKLWALYNKLRDIIVIKNCVQLCMRILFDKICDFCVDRPVRLHHDVHRGVSVGHGDVFCEQLRGDAGRSVEAVPAVPPP